MNTVDPELSRTRPGVIPCLRAGFDAIAGHVELILFPIMVDLIIWLGPRVKLKALIQTLTGQMSNIPGFDLASDEQARGIILDFWQYLAERVNLLAFLRTYPVGVPSLMSGRLPVEIPGGQPISYEVNTFVGVFICWLILSILGLLIGTLYYIVVAQVSLQGNVDWKQAFAEWPSKFLQILLLSVLLSAIFLSISLPSSCFLSSFALSGISIGQFALFIYIGFVVWLFFPLVLSSHGIIIYRQKILVSLLQSIRLIRSTMPMSGLLILTIFILSQGMDVIWKWPAEGSWFSLIGIAGHAFVTTALLAATFIYYRDGIDWLQNMIDRLREDVQRQV